MSSLPSEIESILLTQEIIAERVATLAQEITEQFAGKELTVVALMKGSVIFLADLLRQIPIPLRLETINVSSYHGGMKSSGKVSFPDDLLPDIVGRHILLIDDILETGLTLQTIRDYLKNQGAASIYSCVLLHKQQEKIPNIEADYVGFTIPDVFVVGYGLDYQELYRNMPDIAILKG